MDHLTLTDVGFDERNPVYLSPINIFGSNPNGAPVAEPGDGDSPTGSIKILHALIRDRSARPYMRIVDPRGFRGVEFTGSVVNPYGCAVAAEAGFPLRNIFSARIPPSNLSVHTVCNKSVWSDSKNGATTRIKSDETHSKASPNRALNTGAFPYNP